MQILNLEYSKTVVTSMESGLHLSKLIASSMELVFIKKPFDVLSMDAIAKLALSF